MLGEWGLSALAPDSELLVSELVTNAVQAAAGCAGQSAVRLRLSGDRARVLIEVWDANPRPPVPKNLGEDGTPDPEEEGGRGLFLVATLSQRWGWLPTHEPPGKLVWCEYAGPPAPVEDDPQALLPRRVRYDQAKRPVKTMTDLDVLRRVRDRLREHP